MEDKDKNFIELINDLRKGNIIQIDDEKIDILNYVLIGIYAEGRKDSDK